MGGLGSGNWCRWGSKRTVESCRSIDARWLVRQGMLESGIWRPGSLKWTDHETGKEISSIGYVIDTQQEDSGTMRLRYTHCPGGSRNGDGAETGTELVSQGGREKRGGKNGSSLGTATAGAAPVRRPIRRGGCEGDECCALGGKVRRCEGAECEGTEGQRRVPSAKVRSA
jgi:hypothetical protein